MSFRVFIIADTYSLVKRYLLKGYAMDFPERLRSLREQFGYTQAAISEQLGTNQRMYRRYELGTSQPTLPVLIKMADLFSVSLDYLTARSDDPEVR